MYKGKVVLCNHSLGYSIVDSEETKTILLMHDDLNGQKIELNNSVSFDLQRNNTGFVAKNIKVRKD